MSKIVFAFIALLSFCSPTFAQKGMQGFGVNLAGNVCDHGNGIGGELKYQYNITDFIRLEPTVGVYSIDRSAYRATALVNMHYFFSSPRAFRPFIFAGPGFVSFSKKLSSINSSRAYRDTIDDFGLDGGFGLDYRITHNFSLQAQIGGLYGVSSSEIAGKYTMGFCFNF
jgi:hypothetical protein